VQKARQVCGVNENQHQISAGAIEENAPYSRPESNVELAATPDADGIAADPGGQYLVKEHPNQDDLQQDGWAR
jgi:hypothetical protein